MQALLNRRFDRLDTDGNGAIEESDYLAVPRKLAEIVGADKPGVDGLEKAYQALWQRLCEQKDANNDGVISREEFVAANEEAFAKDGYDQWLRPIIDAYMTALDADGDGTLSTSELAVIATAAGVDSEDAAAAHKLADADYDGKLSADELHRLAQEFYNEAGIDSTAIALYNGIGI
jgi:Ca2+-binding EF-hand superfamily protein